MALILIRADSKKKILNALADMERHAKLNILGKPKIIPSKLSNEVIKRILKQNIRSKSKWSVLVRVEEETTASIMQIKKIHPPAHMVVLSSEYEDYSYLKSIFRDLSSLKGYYSPKKN